MCTSNYKLLVSLLKEKDMIMHSENKSSYNFSEDVLEYFKQLPKQTIADIISVVKKIEDKSTCYFTVLSLNKVYLCNPYLYEKSIVYGVYKYLLYDTYSEDFVFSQDSHSHDYFYVPTYSLLTMLKHLIRRDCSNAETQNFLIELAALIRANYYIESTDKLFSTSHGIQIFNKFLNLSIDNIGFGTPAINIKYILNSLSTTITTFVNHKDNSISVSLLSGNQTYAILTFETDSISLTYLLKNYITLKYNLPNWFKNYFYNLKELEDKDIHLFIYIICYLLSKANFTFCFLKTNLHNHMTVSTSYSAKNFETLESMLQKIIVKMYKGDFVNEQYN